MKSLLFLLILAGGAYYAWTRDWPSRTLQESGARLERRIDRELSAAGITDRQILSQVRREHRRWYVLRWVETDREISVSTPEGLRHVTDDVSHLAEDEGYAAESGRVRDATLLDVSRFGLRFQRLVLVVPTASPAGKTRRTLKTR